MNERKLTTEEFIVKAKKVHGNDYDYSLTKYVWSKTPIKIICKQHGIFQQTPNNHLRGSKCFKCRGSKKLTTKEFIQKAKIIHGNTYDYSMSNYGNVFSKIKIICKKHGIFCQIARQHIRGAGCPSCKAEKVGNRCRSNLDEFIEKANKIHLNRYDYSNVKYNGSYKKVIITCKKHGSFRQTPNNHINNHGCPRCAFRISKSEKNFLDYYKIKNRQVLIGTKQVDGLNKKSNTIYEFLGDYWHGNPKKFNSNQMNELCKSPFGKLYLNTIKRFDLLKRMGYNIKYIWESDWKDFVKGFSNQPNLIIHK